MPIGFEQTLHTVTEGVDPFVELCAIVLGNVQLERDALVSFATRDNTATSIGESGYKAVVRGNIWPTPSYLMNLPFMFLSTTAPVDFGGAAVDFTFGPGVSRLCVEVTIEDDDILEDEEDFFGTLTTTDPGVTLSPDLILVIIREDSFDGKSYCTCYCNAVVKPGRHTLIHFTALSEWEKLTYTNTNFIIIQSSL